MCHAGCSVGKFVFVDACATWRPLESGVDVSRCEMVEFGPDVVFWDVMGDGPAERWVMSV